LCFPVYLGWQAHATTPSHWLRWGLVKFFWQKLASKGSFISSFPGEYLPDLHLPSSSDYRLEGLHTAKTVKFWLGFHWICRLTSWKYRCSLNYSVITSGWTHPKLKIL
jgi:hypothetical protein